MTAVRAMRHTSDGADPFDLTVIAAERPTCAVLFAAGRGGDPVRHLSLLQALAGAGCKVIAPHFDMFSLAPPGRAELEPRLRRLEAAAREHAPTGLPLYGVGHSIGTVCLLVLAGATAHSLAGEAISFSSGVKISRLALFAPPTRFFWPPDALQAVRVPVSIRAGADDTVTPPDQAQFLQSRLESHTKACLRIDARAGHFTYMDTLPPNVTDPHPERSGFLEALARETAEFLLN